MSIAAAPRPWLDAAGADEATFRAAWDSSPISDLVVPGALVPAGLVADTLDLLAWLGTEPLVDGRPGADIDPLWPLSMRLASSRSGGSERGQVSHGGSTRLLCCVDGWIALSLARPSDVELLPAWLELDGFDNGSNLHGAEAPWERVSEAVAHRWSSELVERAALLGLPCSALGEVTDVRPVLEHRIAPDRFSVRSGATSAAGRTKNPAGSGRPAVGTLSGLTVVNLASLWAGPLAAAVLGRHGARVMKVESVQRPDGGRSDPELFGALHSGCEFVSLDFRSADGRGRLLELIESADIVIEGSRPRALEQLGIDAAGVLRRRAEKAPHAPQVWVSITGHGREGSAATRVGFGDDAAVAGGLVGRHDGVPVFAGDAVADPLSGLTAAAAALDAIARQSSVLLDVALASVAAAATHRSSFDLVDVAR